MDGFRKRGVTLNLLQKEGGTQKGELPSEKGIPTLEETMPKLEASINLEAKSISTIIKISDSVERIARALLSSHSKTTKTTFVLIQRIA